MFTGATPNASSRERSGQPRTTGRCATGSSASGPRPSLAQGRCPTCPASGFDGELALGRDAAPLPLPPQQVGRQTCTLDKPAPYHPRPASPAARPHARGCRSARHRPRCAPPLWPRCWNARGTRMTMVRGIVDGLTHDDLGRECPRLPAPRVPGGSTLGRPLSGRGHEGGVRAPPLRGPRPRGAGSGPRRRAAHRDAPPC